MSSEDLDNFTSSALRGQKKGIYEHSLCSLIMKGVQTENKLTKIFTVCEGALLSENKDKLNLETVKVCSDVCLSFQNTYPAKFNGTEYLNVAWIFSPTEENYHKYIKPWHNRSLRYYPLLTVYRQREYPMSRKRVYVKAWDQLEHHNKIVEYEEQLIKKIGDDLANRPEGFSFFVKTSALTVHSFNVLQGEFTAWALTQLSDTRRELTKEISPKIWKDFTGQEKEKEEEDRE